MQEQVKPKFQDLIQNPDVPVLVDFYADWCGPCKTMAPVIQDIAGHYSGKIKVVKVDIDKNQAVADFYKIMGVPTFILFKKGEVVWRQSGISTAALLKKSIDGFI